VKLNIYEDIMKKNEENRVWKPRKSRFIVEECSKCSNDRQFKNGKVVYNQNLGRAYSVDEIVEVLNTDYFRDYLFELLQEKIWYCQAKKKELHDKKIDNCEYDDETVFTCIHWEEKYTFLEAELKKLRDECYNYNSIFKYSDFLEEQFNEKEK
jgi:hypothetical protein